MQYFLNGFMPGDPAISFCARFGRELPTSDFLPKHVDVLIVGGGPAGLTLAAQLAAFPDITTRIVEQKPGPLQIGQADGIACRTMEMFQAFGFCEQVLRESYWVNETCFWRPDETRPQHIVRSRVIQDVEGGLSEMPHVILNQARVHDLFLDVMRHAPAPLRPDYSLHFVDLTVDDSAVGNPSAYPLTARIERVSGIDRNKGALVVVRPDQYIAHVLPLDAHYELARFFGTFMSRAS